MPPVEKFDLALLPESLRDLAADTAERMQVPVDYPAAVAVLCLAAAVGRRAAIQPKEKDSTWIVVLNLWGFIVGSPSTMKSPVISQMTIPLERLQGKWQNENEEEMKCYELESEKYDLTLAAWKEEFKRSKKKAKTPELERPSMSLEKPKLRRLIVNDSTVETLHEIMRDNPSGVLVLRDELSGWLANLERQGRENDRSFYLETWNGDKGYTVDRIHRGHIHAEACCTSMMGGIQPAKLRSYLVDTVRQGAGNDGLTQRFQLSVWPDATKDWRRVDREPNEAAILTASSVLEKLADLEPKAAVLRFSFDAQQLFNEWHETLEKRLRQDELHPAVEDHLGKYRSLMPTLAALFQLADWASGQCEQGPVSLEHTKQAAAWCAYLESHDHRIYSCAVRPQVQAARDLAAKIKAKKLPTKFRLRDIYRNGWQNLDTPDAACPASAGNGESVLPLR